ncbi:MAG TPA: septum formation initiator family protein [Thermoanaerobaculia bacterium]|nr:septum formation initiator family protein [Thermoanaerobaculia bacterium]
MSDREAPPRPDSLRSVLGAAVLFALVLLAFASVKSHRDLVGARDHERLLKATIGATEHRIERLHGRIQQLRGDADTLDRLAREELGLVKLGDVVIVLPEEPGSHQPAAPPRVPALPAEALPASVPAFVHARGPGGAVH